MKKIVLVLSIFLLTGCFNSEKIMNCESNIENTKDNYKSNIKYKVYYKNKIVTKIEVDETYISDDKYIINYFKESKSAIYDNYNKLYGGYSYKINESDNNINYKVTIDYEKVNLKKMKNDKKIDKEYLDNNFNFTRIGAKTYLENIGASCN